MNKGIWYAVAAYTAWGVLPFYWKWLHHVGALQILGHRIVWSFLMLAAFLLLARRWPALRKAASSRRVLRVYLVAAVLIGINWTTYIWAVNANFIVETSLGYFINPLFSVLLGVLFLRERLRPWQWVPIGLAAAGVLYLTATYGRLPWIALTLALSFGVYGLVKKTAPLGSIYGMTLETGILFLPALGALLYAESNGEGAFLHAGTVSDALLAGAGFVTTVPLLFFASAAQRIPLALVGVLQYIAPTLQFLIGVLYFHEPFSPEKLAGFGVVWIALALFAAEGAVARVHGERDALQNRLDAE